MVLEKALVRQHYLRSLKNEAGAFLGFYLRLIVLQETRSKVWGTA